MFRLPLLFATASVLIAATGLIAATADNLIVCDEVPAMETLAKQIENRLHQTSLITSQDKLPPALMGYRSVIVYIHNDLAEPAEVAFIDYAKSGGKLVLLHHTISSGKRKNKYWFPFLGITLPDTYKYIDDATWNVIPVNGDPPFTMHETEVYLNHDLDKDRTLLLKMRYNDIEQSTAGWKKNTGKGTVYYFMPGHKATDFDYEPYVRVLIGALSQK